MSPFSRGLFLIFSGFQFVINFPKIIRWILVPVIINLLIFGFVSNYSLGWSMDLSTGLLDLLYFDWLKWVFYYPIVIMAGGIALVLSVLLSYALATIVNIPFLAHLSLVSIALSGGKGIETLTWKEWFALNSNMIRASVKKSLVFLGLSVLIFLLSFIPGLNVLSVAFGLFVLAFDAMDYSFENRGMLLSDRWAFLKRHIPFFSGVTLSMGLTLFIPGLTLMIMPFLVVGAANYLVKDTKERSIQ